MAFPSKAATAISPPFSKLVLPSGDGVQLLDATIGVTAGQSTVISSATGGFKSADVGKICSYWNGIVASAANRGYGVITSVQSATLATVQLVAANTTQKLNSCFVYGTDLTVEANAALQAAKASGEIYTGLGILCLSAALIVPDALNVIGRGRTFRSDVAQDHELYNGSIVLLKPISGSSGAVKVGTTYNTKGAASLYGVTVDSMQNSLFAVEGISRFGILDECTFIRASGATTDSAVLRTAKGQEVLNCNIVAQNNSMAVLCQQDSDVKLIGGNYMGAGNNLHTVKISNCLDIIMKGVHCWKTASQSLPGGQVLIETWGGQTSSMISIKENTFDTSHGSHISIVNETGTTLIGCSIASNEAMNNDGVTNNTHSYIKVTGAGTAAIRALNVTGNMGIGSFNSSNNGNLAAFITGVTPPTLAASSVVGNVVNNCAAGYVNFAPNHSSGNVIVPQGSSTPTIF